MEVQQLEHFSKEDIGIILKQLRADAGMTQKEVAEALGRKQQVIGHWETGYAQPDANTLFVLCDLYGADISEAFGFTKKSWYVSDKERRIIDVYRMFPDMQTSVDMFVDKVLGHCAVITTDTVRMFRAAKSEDNKEGGIVEVPRAVLDKLRNAPAVTSNDDI